MKRIIFVGLLIFLLSSHMISCRDKKTIQSLTSASIDLKRGDLISCGPEDGELFGTVSFSATVPEELKKDFNMAISLLHSFEYDESEKVFARIIDKAPDCAMAYWGVAMSNFHPLWTPPSQEEMEKGSRAIQIAQSIKNKTKRESDYIEAMAVFYKNPGEGTYRERLKNYEKAMENLYQLHKEDKEAAVFYALALNASAVPTDKTYSNQRKAVSILTPIFDANPMHPGLAHYIIHNCDYPSMAELALPAARKYASIAPASAHAQHMPSHIFIRLGLWDESIKSNLVSVYSAQCYAEKAKLKGHWDEELHGLDYLMYAYLQKGDDTMALKQLEYLKSIDQVDPVTFKTAYAFAAIPARYTLERKMWKEAAALPIHPTNYPWEKFPWQKAIIHFARVMGTVQTGNLPGARKELATMKDLHDILKSKKDKAIEASHVMVQIKTAEAWITLREGNKKKALELMEEAAVLEDGMEKHPVTPGEVLPARELLGEMLLETKDPVAALQAFEMNLQSHKNRFNSLYGAGVAARMTGNNEKARLYFRTLLDIAGPGPSDRKQVAEVRSIVSRGI
jgi:tetratricopeptide (TPR) repeat protein